MAAKASTPGASNPPKPLAPHVRAAMAAVQAKRVDAAPPRAPAAHVMAALRSPLQAKLPAPAGKAPAPHVQRAVQGGQLQQKAVVAARPAAAHLAAAVAQGRQAPNLSRGAAAQAKSTGLPPLAAPRRSPAPPPTFVRPVVQASQLSLSVSDGAREVVDRVRNQVLTEGPGNLHDSSKKARQRFSRASEILDKLREHRDMHQSVLDALSRMTFSVPESDTVRSFVNREENYSTAVEIGKYKKQENQNAQNLAKLAEAVYFDFVASKAGGGSCDHASASTFLRLAEVFPERKIGLVRYRPSSTEQFDIAAPESAPYHRTVFFKGDEDLEVDSWWPGGKVHTLTKESEYPDLELLVEWNPGHSQFTQALRQELENQYRQIEPELSQDEPSDKVGLVWTVAKK